MEIIPPHWKLKTQHAKLEICETSPPNIKLFMCMMHTMNEAYNFVVTMAYVWVPCTTPINIGIIQQTRIPKLLTIKWCITIISMNASREYKYVSPHPTRECNEPPTKRSMWEIQWIKYLQLIKGWNHPSKCVDFLHRGHLV